MCRVSGCTRKARYRSGLCGMHYMRDVRGITPEENPGKCQMPNNTCKRRSECRITHAGKSRWLCGMHYIEYKRHPNKRICKKCWKFWRTGGLCRMHSTRISSDRA